MHYNPELPLVLTTDASNYGIAGTLSHMDNGEEKPIACVSRTLMPSEKNYSIVQKESLAIYYAVKKFEKYLVGTKFTLKTDQKCLTTIFGENKQLPVMHAARLQRWALYLSGFNYEIKYIKGKHNFVSDFLSRAPLEVKVIDSEYDGKGEYLNFVNTEGWPIDNHTVAKATNEDPVLRRVIEMINKGKWSEMDDGRLKSYYSKKDEITYERNILMWGYRVIIPEKLRSRILRELHTAHLGISKTKSLARSYLYWPNIDKDIENMIVSCVSCLNQRSNPPQVKLTSWESAGEPWKRVHADFMHLKGKTFLIIIDSFSKYPVVYVMKTLSAEETGDKLRECFSIFGIPHTLVTDNGSQLVSKQLQEFYQKNGIKHITSPVGHQQSNGQAENAVKTFKAKLKTALNDRENKQLKLSTLICRFLFNYRNAEHSTTKESPAKLLFGRTLRNRFELLKTQPAITKETTIGNRRNQNKRQERKTFHPGSLVMARDYRDGVSSWTPAIIIEKIGRSTYLCKLEEDGRIWKRHMNQLIKRGKWKGFERRENASSNDAVISKVKQLPVVRLSYKPSDNDLITSQTKTTHDSGFSTCIPGNNAGGGVNSAINANSSLIDKGITNNSFIEQDLQHQESDGNQPRALATSSQAEIRIEPETVPSNQSRTTSRQEETRDASDKGIRRSTRLKKKPSKLCL